MFEAIRKRLTEIQDFEVNLLDAAISVATEMRQKVREGRRARLKARREDKRALRDAGHSAKEVREILGSGKRRSSGVSIDAMSTGTGVKLTASSQVQHLRRAQGETPDVMEAFAKHFRVAEQWRARRGL